MDVLGIFGFHRSKKLQQIPRRNRSYSLPENRYIPRVMPEPALSEEEEEEEEEEDEIEDDNDHDNEQEASLFLSQSGVSRHGENWCKYSWLNCRYSRCFGHRAQQGAGEFVTEWERYMRS